MYTHCQHIISVNFLELPNTVYSKVVSTSSTEVYILPQVHRYQGILKTITTTAITTFVAIISSKNISENKNYVKTLSKPIKRLDSVKSNFVESYLKTYD